MAAACQQIRIEVWFATQLGNAGCNQVIVSLFYSHVLEKLAGGWLGIDSLCGVEVAFVVQDANEFSCQRLVEHEEYSFKISTVSIGDGSFVHVFSGALVQCLDVGKIFSSGSLLERSLSVYRIYFLNTSLTFSPACFNLPFTWSTLPSSSSLSSPVVFPTISLTLPFAIWALFLALSLLVTVTPFLFCQGERILYSQAFQTYWSTSLARARIRRTCHRIDIRQAHFLTDDVIGVVKLSMKPGIGLDICVAHHQVFIASQEKR